MNYLTGLCTNKTLTLHVLSHQASSEGIYVIFHLNLVLFVHI